MQRFCFDISDQHEYRLPSRLWRGDDQVSPFERIERIELELLAASSILDTDPATTKWERIELDAEPVAAPRRLLALPGLRPTPVASPRPAHAPAFLRRVPQRPALAMAGLVAVLAVAACSIVSIF